MLPYRTQVVDASSLTAVNGLLNRLRPDVFGPWLSTSPLTQWFQQRAAERFWREGDEAVGGAWERLKESTWEIRKSLGYAPDHPINERTGELKRFATEGDGGGRIIRPGVWQFLYPGETPKGELADKVATAQLGREKPATVPRPIFGLDGTDVAVATSILGRFIEGEYGDYADG